LERATKLFLAQAAPRGVFASVGTDRFGAIYEGEGQNAPRTPLGLIFPRADGLALFAVTIGSQVEATVTRLFADGEYGLGYMLDSVASRGAETTADRVEKHYSRRYDGDRNDTGRLAFLRYSPGYCGWDVSGQRKLFAELRPEEIGISLRETFLMNPLKSVSGVIVTGPPEIHVFENSYPFCASCATRECLGRIETALRGARRRTGKDRQHGRP
jgi:hypothetical protein